MTSRHLAITMGDPAGIGPEIIVKACIGLQDRIAKGDLRLLIIGSGAALERRKGGARRQPRYPAGERRRRATGPLSAFCRPTPKARRSIRACCRADGGRFAFKAIERGVRLAQAGRIRGHRHGAAQQGSAEQGRLPLSRAHRDAGASHRRARLGDAAGPRQHARQPCLDPCGAGGCAEAVDPGAAASGDRPHRTRRCAGSASRAPGSPWRRSIRMRARAGCSAGRTSTSRAPTIAKAVADGLDVVGPVPGDTVFVKLRAGQYDAVVAMYHDQGHIPVKLLGFEVDPATGRWEALSGVNITLGPADHPHLRRPRHRLRHRRQGHRQRAQPDRGDRLRRAPGRGTSRSSAAMRPDAQ